ncbi:MAG: hypothetical protein CBB87_03030 [Micavibrio sp. TMED27]|nr:hypothetical protein [Micavibrio sp.]OUT92120.1 MAG: hypothetical protein CBB87_03030 [Micavibrio sp. TMED27]|tara:strand:- start:60 stop:563 length:504 start_codon:yes stop_codon:yes gene_type:complete
MTQQDINIEPSGDIKPQSSSNKTHKTFVWSALVVGLSHTFCCIIPGIFSLLALLSVFGFSIALPGWAASLHAITHSYELYIIGVSGVLLAVGWASLWYSRKHDCHETGCHHSTCQPRKRNVNKVLLFATGLFMINLGIYIAYHMPSTETASTEIIHNDHAHEHDHEH